MGDSNTDKNGNKTASPSEEDVRPIQEEKQVSLKHQIPQGLYAISVLWKSPYRYIYIGYI